MSSSTVLEVEPRLACGSAAEYLLRDDRHSSSGRHKARSIERALRPANRLRASNPRNQKENRPFGCSDSGETRQRPRGVKGAPLSLEVSELLVGADGLAALARGMAPSLTALLLDRNECTNRGGDLSGLKLLCSALESEFASGLKELSLTRNKLQVEGCMAIAAALEKTQITSLNLDSNLLGGYMRPNFSNFSGTFRTYVDFVPEMSGILKLAEVVPRMQLTRLSVRDNRLDANAKKAIQAAAGIRVHLQL